MMVRISFSEDGALSTLVLMVVAAIASFMTDEVSVGTVSNFSCRLLSDQAIRNGRCWLMGRDYREDHVNGRSVSANVFVPRDRNKERQTDTTGRDQS